MRSAEGFQSWIIRVVTQAESYRDFLRCYFSEAKALNPSFSSGVFAKKCGFASRNYPRDIIAGHKRVTLKSLPLILRGMGLSGDAARYFTLLVIKEEPDLNTEGLTATQMDLLREKIKTRILQRPQKGGPLPKKPLFHLSDWPLIYASLGETGTTVPEMSKKTGRPEGICSAVLDMMAAEHHVVLKEGRYTAVSESLAYLNLTADQGFMGFYLASLEHMKDSVKKHLNSSEHLFMNATVSVLKTDIPNLKQKLRETICQFVADAERSAGDTVVNLNLGFVPVTPTPSQTVDGADPVSHPMPKVPRAYEPLS